MSIFYVTMNCVDIAVMQDNSIQMKRDIQSFIYNLRLSAEVQVIEMVCKHLCSSFFVLFLDFDQFCFACWIRSSIIQSFEEDWAYFALAFLDLLWNGISYT